MQLIQRLRHKHNGPEIQTNSYGRDHTPVRLHFRVFFNFYLQFPFISVKIFIIYIIPIKILQLRYHVIEGVANYPWSTNGLLILLEFD